jgi:hypothetical protein
METTPLEASAAVVGSIICYKGLVEPEGWIFCDGIPRENIDGKYNGLLEIEIGTLEEGTTAKGTLEKGTTAKGTTINKTMYIPPNYDNFMITQLGDSYEKVLEFLLDDVKTKKERERCHTYLKHATFANEYNNDFIGMYGDTENTVTKPKLHHHQVRWILKI